jgi:hypothetical protein
MLVKIRLREGPRVQRKLHKNQNVALAFSSLLTPAALMAFALGVWRIAADLDITRQFGIPSGFFSHWQVWIGSAAVLELVAIVLNRYGNIESQIQNSEGKAAPTILNSGF